MNQEHRATIAASLLVLMMIVAYLKKNDPDFDKSTRAALDSILGAALIPGQTPDPFYQQVRAEFFNIMDANVISFRAAAAAAPQKPRTLRRRFLNWLQRG